MGNSRTWVTRTVGVVGGALLAAAFSPVGVAFADGYALLPDPSTFDITQVDVGYPPLIDVVTGFEAWDYSDLTTAVNIPTGVGGTDILTTFGSFTNDNLLTSLNGVVDGGNGVDFTLPMDTQIDFASFGGGFGNEWIDIPVGAQLDPGISDLLITPFGDYEMAGSFFADLAPLVS